MAAPTPCASRLRGADDMRYTLSLSCPPHAWVLLPAQGKLHSLSSSFCAMPAMFSAHQHSLLATPELAFSIRFFLQSRSLRRRENRAKCEDKRYTWTIRRRRSGTLCRRTGRRRGTRAPSWCRAGRRWSHRRGRACRRSPRRGSSRCSSRGRCTCACRRCRPGLVAAGSRCRRRRRRQDGPGARRGRGPDEASFFSVWVKGVDGS